jgi:hypothetical protein
MLNVLQLFLLAECYAMLRVFTKKKKEKNPPQFFFFNFDPARRQNLRFLFGLSNRSHCEIFLCWKKSFYRVFSPRKS